MAGVLLVGWLRGGAPAEAHGINASYTEITLSPTRVDAAYLFTVDDILTHFPIGVDRRAPVAIEDLDRTVPGIFAFLAEHVTLTLDGTAVALQPGSHRAHASGTFIRFELSRPLERPPATLALAFDASFFERFGPQHANFVRVAVDDRIQQAVLTSDDPIAPFSTGYRPLLAQCGDFIELGIGHIFVGYDHIMFLFALTIVGGRLGQLVQIVTAFTVAHSLTLILAALQVVTLPSRLIEGGIALTIAYVAFDNFFVVATTAHRWVLTFCFGLVHGFGFANTLREMSLPKRGLIPTLVSFNVGVEIGQVAIVAVLFPLTLWLARQRFRRRFVLAVSGVIFLFGVGWFVQRAFHLSFMPI